MVNIISKMFTLASNVKRLDKIHYWIYDDLNHLVHNPGGRQGSSLTPESRQGKSWVLHICENQRRRQAAHLRRLTNAICSSPPWQNIELHLYDLVRKFQDQLGALARMAGLCLTWSEIPKTDFLASWLMVLFVFHKVNSQMRVRYLVGKTYIVENRLGPCVYFPASN